MRILLNIWPNVTAGSLQDRLRSALDAAERGSATTEHEVLAVIEAAYREKVLFPIKEEP